MRETFFKHDMPSRTEGKRLKLSEKTALRRALWREVYVRDGYRCRACGRGVVPSGIDALSRGDVHHIKFRSQGGKHRRSNLVVICRQCHEEVHQHRLAIEGNADERLTFSRRVKHEWYVSKQETSVHVVEKD